MGDGSYSLRPEEMRAVIRDLRTCQRDVERHLDDLRLQARRLHDTWDGLAAEAHLVAQAVIEDGIAEMGRAIDDFAAANESAHAGYQAAWDANLALWRAVL